MTAYRTLALVPPPEKVEHAGPREKCPACGAGYRIDVRACRGRSWLLRLFGGCARRDLHLHQKCYSCGAEWTCGPAEET